jgi:hypothetical protein
MNSIARSENQALARTVLELDVNNHPGVMSHVVGLFSRRAYNVEGILVHAGRAAATPAASGCWSMKTNAWIRW